MSRNLSLDHLQAPKRSDLVHVTFHFFKSAVLLSVPESTSVSSLKDQFFLAIAPLASSVPVDLPSSTNDIQLWEDREAVEGATESPGRRIIEAKNLQSWGRWKTVYVSFGQDSEPEFTMPELDDEEPEEEQ